MAELSKSDTELLPCPFCGKPPVLLTINDHDGFDREYAVRCDYCGVEQNGEYRSTAVEAWNTRSVVAQQTLDADRFRWMEQALRTIARFPVTDPKNLDAANMQIIALAVVDPEPVPRNTEKFARLSSEPLARIPEGYSAPLDTRSTAEMLIVSLGRMAERLQRMGEFKEGVPYSLVRGEGDLLAKRVEELRTSVAPHDSADYSAWLIEINQSASVGPTSGPIYFHYEYDDDWTTDHDKATHFARKQDAQSVIDHYGWTEAKPVEHMWPTSRSQEEKGPSR